MKLLIDECLHTSLVAVAHAAGHAADHVVHCGLGDLKDWQLMLVIRGQEYTFVTNNLVDFIGIYGKEPTTRSESIEREAQRRKFDSLYSAASSG